MTAAEVAEVIEKEIAGDWARSNAHGVDLRKCLVLPATVQEYADSFREAHTIELWLVLEECPGKNSGYKIVFDENAKQFGLAIAGERQDVFIGYYGTFLETLEGM